MEDLEEKATRERIERLNDHIFRAEKRILALVHVNEFNIEKLSKAESALTTARIDGARAFVASVSSDLMSSDARVAWLEIVLDRWLASESKEG